MKRANPIPAMSGCDALFPNDFGEDIIIIIIIYIYNPRLSFVVKYRTDVIKFSFSSL